VFTVTSRKQNVGADCHKPTMRPAMKREVASTAVKTNNLQMLQK